ncbi:MAG TPA: tRNA (cytidine(34)-2'-O)-methyltransferase [Pelomicrobium sp.]|nr:tRNA (cytidine(34)-2'-O)-methyltransferase [Pelomicrobium sp.]
MFDVVLYQPEIPVNAGVLIRLCANAGARLHLVKPLGFQLDDRRLRRVGLDYHSLGEVTAHTSWQDCRTALAAARFFALTTRGSSRYDTVAFRPGDAFVFGPETRGLPDAVLAEFSAAHRLRIPMAPGNRSLNVANAAAVMLFEAWRQQGFRGGA